MNSTLFIALLATLGAQYDVSPSDQTQPKPETRIDIRISPAIDFHFHARVIAAKKTSYPKTGAFGGTVAAVKELNEQLGPHLLAQRPPDGVQQGNFLRG